MILSYIYNTIFINKYTTITFLQVYYEQRKYGRLLSYIAIGKTDVGFSKELFILRPNPLGPKITHFLMYVVVEQTAQHWTDFDQVSKKHLCLNHNRCSKSVGLENQHRFEQCQFCIFPQFQRPFVENWVVGSSGSPNYQNLISDVCEKVSFWHCLLCRKRLFVRYLISLKILFNKYNNNKNCDI